MDVPVNSFGRRSDHHHRHRHHHHHHHRSQQQQQQQQQHYHRSQTMAIKSFLQSSARADADHHIRPSSSSSSSSSSSPSPTGGAAPSASLSSPPSSCGTGGAQEEVDKRRQSSNPSNLRRFIQHTTPKVPAQTLPMSSCTRLSSKLGQKDGADDRDHHHHHHHHLDAQAPKHRYFFSLSDLWDSFDEWSAYGAGVPIVLDEREDVVVTQYYVPYLSALQLYSSSAIELASKQRGHRLGDDSDGSELEYRDSNSETSSIDGCDQLLVDRASCGNSLNAGQLESEECLLFEYFESAAPSLRAPLFDKVKDLSMQFRGLKVLNSNDLSPSSWFSVAWYPIYRIPSGATLNGQLGACFLTYHPLSTLTGYTPGNSNSSLNVCSDSTGEVIRLDSFGFAGYKFRGPIWMSVSPMDRHYAASLQRSTYEWLKRLFVCHPDFEYFMLHSGPTPSGSFLAKTSSR